MSASLQEKSGSQLADVTVGDLIVSATARLGTLENCDAARDARILLASVLQIQPGLITARLRENVSLQDALSFDALVDARFGGKPVHRILGSREFYGHLMRFGNGCLEPRPETELLVERILNDYDPDAAFTFYEVGVGSGAICVSILAERPNASAVGADIAAGAIDHTRMNAEAHGVSQRLELVVSDCLKAVDGVVDFVVSNPPYIASDDIRLLAREVHEHDPVLALDGGEDGFDFYRRLLVEAKPVLRPGGKMYLETGHGQHEKLIAMGKENGWGIVSTHLDLSGLERIVVLRRQASESEFR